MPLQKKTLGEGLSQPQNGKNTHYHHRGITLAMTLNAF
jgi:hypothetical protein